MNSLDARVRYTRKVIEDAFMGLLEKKPVARITVTEICQIAQINRATFYKHYLDVPDLLDQMEQRLLSELKDVIGEMPEGEKLTKAVLLDAMARMLEYVKNGAGKYMILAGDGADPTLPMKTFDMMNRQFYPLLSQRIPHKNENQMKMLYHYLTLGCGGAMTIWIRGGMRESCEEMAQFLVNLSEHTSKAMLY